MSISAIVPPLGGQAKSDPASPNIRAAIRHSAQVRNKRTQLPPLPTHFPAQADFGDGTYRQAELFYLQKQIQSQTPMVVVLEDGEQIEGCIEWYDRNSVKIRGRIRTLVYKAAIKYMYKVGEQG